jgi:hypothetical protein
MHDLLCKAWTERGLEYSAQGRISSNLLYGLKCTLDEKPSVFIRDKSIFWSERMSHKDYDPKSSLKKISVREPQGAWRQDELIGGKPRVVK